MGARYQIPERFKPLKGGGKPLWEFKEFDHRVYSLRTVIDQERVEVVLFNGWVKDKRGKSDEETRRIEEAKGYYAEYLAEREEAR
jgi:hypothetical protein